MLRFGLGNTQLDVAHEVLRAQLRGEMHVPARTCQPFFERLEGVSIEIGQQVHQVFANLRNGDHARPF